MKILDFIITDQGLMTIKFENSLEKIKLLWHELKDKKHKRRQLQTSKISDLDGLLDLFKVVVFRDQIENDLIKASFEIVDITDHTIVMQLTFTNSEEISREGQEDYLQFTFNIQKAETSISSPVLTSIKIPQQISAEEEVAKEKLKENSAVAGAAAQAATLGITLGSKLLYGSISQLWGLINGLSLFVHLPLTGV